MDWKQIVSDVAPTLGGLLTTYGGPAGALAGAGVMAVGRALGVPMSGDPVQDEAAVGQALAGGLTPEQRTALIAADGEYRKALLAADVRKTEIAAQTEAAYIADVDAARRAHAQQKGVLVLAYVINVASYLTVAGVLYGCFVLLGAKGGLQIDPGIAAMLGGIVGAAVQWVLSNSGQANGFVFGSSPGSRQTAADLGGAIKGALSRR